jgi:hypothetical protein
MSDPTPRSEPEPESTDLSDRELPMEAREKLVRKFQYKALARSNPLAANIGIIAGDLMRLAHMGAVSMQNAIAESKSAGEVLQPDELKTDLYLKLVRQLDRMARMDHEIAPPSEEESVARGPRPSSRWRE